MIWGVSFALNEGDRRSQVRRVMNADLAEYHVR